MNRIVLTQVTSSLVRKKDGSLRLCIDFRSLNKRTVKGYICLYQDLTRLLTVYLIQSFSPNWTYGRHTISVVFWNQDKFKTAFNLGPLGLY